MAARDKKRMKMIAKFAAKRAELKELGDPRFGRNCLAILYDRWTAEHLIAHAATTRQFGLSRINYEKAAKWWNLRA